MLRPTGVETIIFSHGAHFSWSGVFVVFVRSPKLSTLSSELRNWMGDQTVNGSK